MEVWKRLEGLTIRRESYEDLTRKEERECLPGKLV